MQSIKLPVVFTSLILEENMTMTFITRDGKLYCLSDQRTPPRVIGQDFISGWGELDGDAYLIKIKGPPYYIKVPADLYQDALNQAKSEVGLPELIPTEA